MAMRITRLTYALLAFCLFLATRLGAESVWTIPGIVNARGLNAVTGSRGHGVGSAFMWLA